MHAKLSKIQSSNIPRTIQTKHQDIKSWIDDNWKYGLSTFSERVYCAINNTTPLCDHGKPRRFLSFAKGYSKTSSKCNECKKAINAKKQKTYMARYGVAHPSKSNEVKEKTAKTILKTYGQHFSKTEEHKAKVKNTLQKRYGVDHQMHIPSVVSSIKKTNLKKYGVDNPLKSATVKQKVEDTMMAKYGVIHPLHNSKILAKQKRSIADNINVWHSGLANMSFESREIINNREEFHKFVIGKSRIQIANELSVSANYINVKLREYQFDEFQNYGSSYESQVKSCFHEHIISNSRSIISPFELDLFFPDSNLAIECNGNYWHSELAGGKNRKYHLAKTEACEQKSISLLHFFEDELVFKFPIIQSMISARLGKSTRIFARKTKVVMLKSSSTFENENHLQGVGNSSVKLGLEYDGDIVAIMTFGKNRVAMGSKHKTDEWEMIRFASLNNHVVVGGASKLFKWFVTQYSPSKIVSYANRRYSTGGVYKQLGFVFIHNTPPSQWYIHTSNMLKRFHRFSKRKDVLVSQGFSKSKTAWQILQEEGYDRIWDCGNTKWMWES